MAHFRAQQRHTAGHTATPAAAEHRYLHADFAVAGGNGAGITVVAMHGQAAMVAKRLVVVQGLLQGGLELDGDLAFQLGFQVVQQSLAAHLQRGVGRALYPHFITKPPKTKRYRGARQRGLTTKIHPTVDAHGMPVRLLVTAGTAADCTQAAAWNCSGCTIEAEPEGGAGV